jgi:uncharacterized protein
MAQEPIREVILNYLAHVNEAGVQTRCAILFGSHARNEAGALSDIDLVVISPDFDGQRDERLVDLLWELRAKTDARIEPIACGEKQWQDDDNNLLIEMARQEGQLICWEPEAELV